MSFQVKLIKNLKTKRQQLPKTQAMHVQFLWLISNKISPSVTICILTEKVQVGNDQEKEQ